MTEGGASIERVEALAEAIDESGAEGDLRSQASAIRPGLLELCVRFLADDRGQATPSLAQINDIYFVTPRGVCYGGERVFRQRQGVGGECGGSPQGDQSAHGRPSAGAVAGGCAVRGAPPLCRPEVGVPWPAGRDGEGGLRRPRRYAPLCRPEVGVP